MLEKNELSEIVGGITLAKIGSSLGQRNIIKDAEISEGVANIKLADAALNEDLKKEINDRISSLIEEKGEGLKAEITYESTEPKDINDIKNVVAIMSGKGGVGKSLVTGLTAVALRRLGYNVGILDADLTGPSIPKMFGVSKQPLGSKNGILPVVTKTGISVMSINLLLKDEGDALIWRGPLIAKAINQFWDDVVWGKLDYLLIDLPPGTADAPLTVMQSLPLDGVVVVMTPQDLTAMIVKKALRMAEKLEKPVLGLVENMSYLYVPEIDKKIELFGSSKADEMSEETGIPVLGKLPIDTKLAGLCDEGRVEDYNSDMFEAFSKEITDVLK